MNVDVLWQAMCRSNRSTVSGYFLAGRFMTWLPVSHLSGNVREFGTCLGNVRDVVNSQGNVREKILSWKSVPKLFITG